MRDQVRERVGDEVDHWIRYSTANRFRDTQAWRQPSSNPIGLYVHELRYVNSKVRLTGGLEGTFTAHIEEDVDDREWWEPHTTSRYADFDFTGEFSATFSREGITDASVYVSEPTENQWQYLDGDEDGVVAADSGEHRRHPRRRRGAGETSTTTTSRPSSRIAATASGSEPGSGMCASRARFPLISATAGICEFCCDGTAQGPSASNESTALFAGRGCLVLGGDTESGSGVGKSIRVSTKEGDIP